MSNNIPSIERADSLSSAALSGINLDNVADADWQVITGLVHSVAKQKKSDALRINPSVLFIKTCEAVKSLARLSKSARLPDNIVNPLREFCNNYAENALDELKSQGYEFERLTATKIVVSSKDLDVFTRRNAVMKQGNHTLASKIFMLGQEIAKIEKQIARKQLAYEDTTKLDDKLSFSQRLLRIFQEDLKAEQASKA